ncbi:protein phosphatase CheZ [Telmatospirillum sp.]|uniref:protein phosphatase CheZ n=1 Tax=Telmatospirillum sp. TaxID=2079197 RepID=UPI0028517154|nr:protein phosphatase CheZ [Telmatospirillum sp.]MDR3437183.1 protein phosphatase CheZ [Telmatospirillum sp.]
MAEKKLFTAELQMLKAAGASAPVASVGDASDVLAAINGLREDIRNLKLAAVADEVVEPITETAEEERSRAEVNMLKNEVRALSLAIQHTKAEIAALRPPNANDDRLIAVTNELDAIVSSTEGATNGILEAAEKIDTLAGQLQAQAIDGFAGHVAEDIRESVVMIFESCNFQDITGQRITKVVKTLQYIEDRVNKMIEIWGPDTFEDVDSPAEVHEDDEAKLLNGPQLENQGVSQADIDKMFG